jgi:hypothetical protein
MPGAKVVRFNQDDISLFFGRNAGLRYQNIIADGRISISLGNESISGSVIFKGVSYDLSVKPTVEGGLVSFKQHQCSCLEECCRHVSAAAFHALICHPYLKRTITLSPGGRLLGAPKPRLKSVGSSQPSVTQQADKPIGGTTDGQASSNISWLSRIRREISQRLSSILRR